MTDPRQHAHQLIDCLPETQLSALVGLLEAIVDPVSSLNDAPLDDEPESPEEARAVAASKEWLKSNKGIPFEDVVADLGLTMDQVREPKKSA
jgi:hypothetical protein